MACDLDLLGGYGTGALGNAENPTGQINSYANVTSYNATSIVIGTGSYTSTGINEKFTKGTEIMVHISAANNNANVDASYLGKHIVCNITNVSGNTLTIDKDFTEVLPTDIFSHYQVQAITFAQYQKVTLGTSTIAPPTYNATYKYGGILLVKCNDTICFDGGKIDLLNKGIPTATDNYRPLTAQEKNGSSDTQKYAGWENGSTLNQFILNAGDGAAMIIAKNYEQNGTDSRIGGTTAGKQFTRDTSYAHGGSTIALIAGTMSNFDCSIISKVGNSGRGLGRCYIASDTKLTNDEGLYAYDCISNKYRVMRKLNIKNYGNGGLGDVTNPTQDVNNYASVISISADGKTIGYNNKTTSGMAQIGANCKIMFHVSKHKNTNEMDYLGKLMLATVLSDDGNSLVLDKSVTNVFDVDKLSSYNCQIITVAQFNTLTISGNYTRTAAWSDSTKTGGICAIAVKDKFNLTGGKINVTNKGGGTAYEAAGLKFIGNSQMADILPIGQGHGSVFILTPNLVTDANSRIGALYSGADFAGAGGRDGDKNSTTGKAGGYAGTSSSDGGGGGSGASGGRSTLSRGIGGYGSNGNKASESASGKQGAHLFIIATKLNEFFMQNFSTGGSGAYNAGAGYGGGGFGGSLRAGAGGGYNGGGGAPYNGGGSSGWCFIYCNEVGEENTTGVIAA